MSSTKAIEGGFHNLTDKYKLKNKNQNFKREFKKGCLISGLYNSLGPIIVGYSGGADSSALLYALNLEFASKRKIVAVHVNHGLRGNDSDNDAKHAQSFCISINIEFHEMIVKLPSNSSLGLEADARNLRMDVFKKYLKKYNSQVLILGHHFNDNVETILMRFFEGSGLKGLSGIQQNSEQFFSKSNLTKESHPTFRICRPMLSIKREEILEFCKSNKLNFIEDKTNNDKTRLRNNIRHTILPLLKDSFGDSVLDNIVDSSLNVNHARIIHDEILSGYLKNHISITGSILTISPVSKLLKFPIAIRTGIIKSAVEKIKEITPKLKKVRLPLKKYIHAIDSLILSKKPSTRVNLGKGVDVRREYDKIVIEEGKERNKIEKIIPIEVGGVTKLDEFKMYAETNLLDNFKSKIKSQKIDSTILLDMNSIEKQLVIRSRKEGDRFHPRNSSGGKKLKKYFIDLKVPLIKRDEIPLLAIGSDILWVIGYEYSDMYKVTENTEKCLKITLNKV
ncbi:MAG: tRNA lysidine(34) synthetase TilS [Nitrospinota bacterium]|nr:tRNA lysidine(34) synthetase TilS [Nitrospinota bacterium]